MLGASRWGPGARFLLIAACIVVLAWGLKAAAPILLPFSLALFLAILSLPILLTLQSRGVPSLLAVLITLLVDLAVLGMIVLLGMQSVAEFQDRLPNYAARLQALLDHWVEQAQEHGIPAGEYITQDIVSVGAVADVVGTALQRIAFFLGNAFLVVLIMLFMLSEATVFPTKFRAILGDETGDMGRFAQIIGEVQEYLLIKTLISLATGLCIGGFAWLMGLDFPILLGLIGFILNYVPTVGSIIASVPAILLAMLQFEGVGPPFMVAMGYLAINVVFGNLLEPSLMGRRLGLSTLVVILSLVFWAWVWGPVGALLAVPLTMVVKIGLEHTDDLRWMAVLLDKEPPTPPPTGPPRLHTLGAEREGGFP